jgi:hypothetical protein
VAMQCNSCHAVHEEDFAPASTKLGPELTGIGARYPAAYLLESIPNPMRSSRRDQAIPSRAGAHHAGLSRPPHRRRLIDLVTYLKSLHQDQR